MDSKKRIHLPTANDELVGPLPQPSASLAPPVVPSSASEESPAMNATDEIITARRERTPTKKKGRTQISVYLNEDTLRRLDEVKMRLYFDHKVRANKSDIVECALKEGLAHPERLAQALRAQSSEAG